MDYVRAKVVEPPSNAPVAAKTKYQKGEIRAKKKIIDSIQNNLVAYISNLGTSKEIYDKLVGMFKVNNENQILFLKNKLKDINMDKRDYIQSYFMRITEIKNDLLSIGEDILTGSSLSFHLKVFQDYGMYLPPPFSTMMGYLTSMNYWLDA